VLLGVDVGGVVDHRAGMLPGRDDRPGIGR
jgi:hypothetical protein